MQALFSHVAVLDRRGTMVPPGPHAAAADEPTPAEQRTAEHEPEPAEESAARVALIVEDDRMNREVVMDLLQDSGWVVHAVDCGAKALALVGTASWRPTVIISDFMLPDGRGPEVIARLDALGWRTRVVYLSGRSPDEPEVMEALQRPRTRFLQKPVDLDVLLAELERA